MLMMMIVWPTAHALRDEILNEAGQLLTRFTVSIYSTSFDPITIAVSSLLLAFSKLEVDSTEWIQSIPRCCLEYNFTGISYGTLDDCLQSFGEVEEFTMPIKLRDERLMSPQGIDKITSSPSFSGDLLLVSDF
jgi:hypothetical protein